MSLFFDTNFRFDGIAFFAGLVQTGLYLDFFYSTLTLTCLFQESCAWQEVRAPGVEAMLMYCNANRDSVGTAHDVLLSKNCLLQKRFPIRESNPGLVGRYNHKL